MRNRFRVNKSLIWDYDFRGAYDTEEFKKWYIARVLSAGTQKDLREIGLATIRKYFPSLNLPTKIRQFWQWYFEYAHIH